MSIKDQTSKGPPTDQRNLEDDLLSAHNQQVLQRLSRIENALVNMESRVSERLELLEGRLSNGRVVRKVTAEKPNIRNWLNAQLTKGWISEAEIIEKTGWQTIGVRSFITKSRSLGLSVEEDVREGVPFYRFAR